MIKKILISAIGKAFEGVPKTILRRLVSRKIRESGIDFPEEALDALIEHILSTEEDHFVWNDGSDEVANFHLVFTEEDMRELDAVTSKLLGIASDVSEKAFKVLCEAMHKQLLKDWPIEHAAQQYEVQEFRERLEGRWGKALDQLRMLLTCCREIGNKTARRYKKSKSVKYRYRRWVLLRLHARACQVSDEIFV